METGMRRGGVALLTLLGCLAFAADGFAQLFAPAPTRSQVVRRSARRAKPAPSKPPPAYAVIPEAERIAIQLDLIWTGDYNGMANGDFGKASVAAVKSFQRNIAGKETGVLNPDERLKLERAAKTVRQRIGWQMIDDRTTGAQLGLPTKLVPQRRATDAGTHWQSRHGQIQVDTFRLAGPSLTLAQAFEQQKKKPRQRKVGYSVLRSDFFVVSGLQGLKKFYVRAHEKDHEIRGVTVLYDQATEGIMDPVVIAISNSFEAFPTSLVGGGELKRKVQYASGAVVSAAGDVVTDARAVAECDFILVPGLGRAEKAAEQNDLALLHVYGARQATPLSLAGDAAQRGDVVMVGVADPQTQDGRNAASTVKARLGADGVSITPAPGPGFAGAAALDPDGRLVGIVASRPQKVAGQNAAAAGATLVPAASVKALLAKQGSAPASGRTGLEAAKAAVVRVICVRE
jgi:Trypsin-like peptidase domain/Putative peptidoglycan binding domain